MNIKLILPIIMILLLTSIVSADTAHELEITGVETSGNLVSDSEITFTVKVRNSGEATFSYTNGDTNDIYVAFGDGTYSESKSISQIQPGDTERVTFTHTYTEDKDYTVKAEMEFTDYDWVFKSEKEETISISENVVEPIVLEITEIKTEGTVTKTEPSTILVTVKNTGKETTTSTSTIKVFYDDTNSEDVQTITSMNSNEEKTLTFTHTFAKQDQTSIFAEITYETEEGMKTTKETASIEWSTIPTDDDVNVTEGGVVVLSATELNFGSASQERGQSTTATITLTNTGTKPMTGLKLTALDQSNNLLDSKYNFNVNALETYTIASGETKTLTINLDVPTDKNSRREQVGKLKIEGIIDGKDLSTLLPMYMEAKSYLSIDKVMIEVQNRNLDEKITQGENFDELEEGDEITVTVTLENLYSKSSNIQIEKSYVKIEADENDWDIDDESNDVDIREDDKETYEMTFTIDNLDNDKTDVLIQAFGKDENGNFQHYAELTFELEVQSTSGDIKINDITWKDSSISCKDNYAELEVELKNKGNSDERRAAIRVEIDDNSFSYDETEESIRVNKDDTETVTFRIPLDDNMDSGNYDVAITAYYNTNKKSDTDTTTMKISCSSSSSSSSNSGSTSSTTKTTTTSSNNAASGNIITTTTPSANTITNEEIPKKTGLFDDLGNDGIYLIGLAILIVVLFIGAIILMLVIMKKKN